MARKFELISEMYRDTLHKITLSQGAWRDFLRSACNNYRLPFDDQVLVFAQRPDATAVLEIERWNKQFRRWVNAGATGIAVFDKEYAGRSRLKHYFDISDTHGSSFALPVPVWAVKEDYEPEIIETLQASFGVSDSTMDLENTLLSASSNVIADNYYDYLEQLMTCTEGSFLEELDELNVKQIYIEALECSVAYMLLERCLGGAADQFAEVVDFASVMNFNTRETVNALGCAVSDISEIILCEVAKTVRNLQIDEKKQIRTFAKEPEIGYPVVKEEQTISERSFDYEIELQHEGRIQNPESAPATGAGGTAWEVRITSPDISEGTAKNYLHEPFDLGQAEQSFDGNRPAGNKNDTAVDGTDGEIRGRDGGIESNRPDALGGTDEQHPPVSGGNGAERPDLQLNTGNAGNYGAPERHLPFGERRSKEAEREPEANINSGLSDADFATTQLPAFLYEKLIFGIIENKDDDLKYKKKQIELFFSIHDNSTERAEYLKSAYPDRYTEVMVGDTRVGYKAQENGLLMWKGAYLSRTEETEFSWDCVAGFTAQLIDKKEYYINTDIKKLKNQNSQQMSLFDFDNSDSEFVGSSEQMTLFPSFEISQQIVDEALTLGSNDKDSRLVICAFFMKDKPLEENAAFLAEHYGINGAGFYFNNRKISLWYNASGLRIFEGETANNSRATVITWEQAAKRIRELLDLGRYMPQDELDRAIDYERNHIAENLALTARDFTDEAKETNFAPNIRMVLSEHGGFPEIEQHLSGLLKDPEMLQRITDEWSAFVSALEENHSLLRFSFYRPKELLAKLIDLQREQITFTVAEDYDPKRRFFISKDEIDALLRGSNNDSRLAVYSFYRNHTDKSEREKFLKNYHGEYSGYYNGNDNVNYQRGKGISFSHGSITEPYAKVDLKWNEVEKRVSSLISSGKYLSDEDRAAMPQFERNQLAREIHGFFYNAPEEYLRPYVSNDISDYWEGVKEVAVQLADAAKVQNIYENMMLPLWDSTMPDDSYYDSRKSALEDMRAYLDGTYSVFKEQNTLEPLLPTSNDTTADITATIEQPETENAEISDDRIWLDFQTGKQKNPDALVFVKVGSFYESYDADARLMAEMLGVELTRREISGLAEKQPLIGLPENRISTYLKMLNDRGYDVAIISEYNDKKETELIESTHKEQPVNTFPVGRIDYLGSSGIVGESVEYTNADKFVADIKNENYYGVPMCIILYRDKDGNTIPQNFTQSLDPMPQGFEVVDSPYLPKEAAEPIEELPEKETTENLAPPKPKRERVLFTTLHPEIPNDQRHDFHITDDKLGIGTPSEKFAANVAAIRTLQQIEAEERLATPEEQKTLSKYVGWGGLADCFDERHSKYQELKSLLDVDEYAAARASSLTAFYTSPVIISAMYEALSQMGFSDGNILEPSCGVGNFIGMLPYDMADAKTYGVELDSISGRIARQLYQNSNIAVSGFEKVDMPDSFFDVAIGNVPFGDIRVLDKRYDKNHFLIHDYFFAKTLDKVRPGGIVAFITSKGTMDKENSAVRKYLAQRADLIGAIRLPDNAFKHNAGTDVTADIIFLQKRDRMTDIEPDWVRLDTDENGIKMNSYFVSHPDMILGEMVMQTSQFGMESACKPNENAYLSEQLSDAISNLHAEISAYEPENLTEEEDLSIPADPAVRNFSYTVADGKLYYRENSRMHSVSTTVTGENRIRGMITLRDCVRKLIEYQTENYPDEVIHSEQERLNQLYDAYVKKYDRLFTRGNDLAFSEDSSYCLLCSLEVLDDEGNFKKKADMFSKRTIRPHIPVTSVDTASEALAMSISEKACVDMEYMSTLTGKTADELEKELTGVIFRNVNCSFSANEMTEQMKDLQSYPFVPSDEYLSGNVRKKLQMLRALMEVLPAEEKQMLTANLTALEAVQPVDLTAAEISVRIGATWIPPEIYQKFMFELLGTGSNGRHNMKILFSKCSGEWNVSNKNADYGNIKSVSTYGTNRINAYHIFEQTLNLKDVRIFDTVIENGNEVRVFNKKETAIAQDRQELIKSKFVDWLWKDIDRREMLCKLYNETFNSIRPREYDGSNIIFSGMNPEITLRKHQINAIAHIMYGGNTLLAHEVGAGKTYEMVAAAMEMKRLGLCSKSLIVVPNHITGQWAAEFLQLYPSANLLVATKKDFERQNRRKICSRIATGEYDAIVIGHSQLEKIPMSKERQQAILQQQIDEIVDGIIDAKADKAERYTIKQMEKTKKSLETRLEKLNDQSRKDDVVTFEELGIDRLFIDESHYFKNLFLMTKMRNVGGISQTEAQKSSDLFMKCRYIDEITNDKGIIFATGTPISNSMVELYTIQRYLQYKTLQEAHLQHFDSWASTFGETVTAIELSPEGYNVTGF